LFMRTVYYGDICCPQIMTMVTLVPLSSFV
jgi:hypothetical protein